MCVYGGGAVPQGGLGDRHLVTVPQGVVGDRLPWGGERQGGGRVSLSKKKKRSTIYTPYFYSVIQVYRFMPPWAFVASAFCTAP